MKNTTSSLLLGLALLGCKSNDDHFRSQPPVHEHDAAEHHDHGDEGPASRPVSGGELLDGRSYEHFGDGVHAGPEPVSIAALTTDAMAYDGKKVRVTGSVESVCKKKGCWMKVADGDAQVFVRFRDYGFFMPLDCEGRTVVLEGTFNVKEQSIADRKHYLEDEGKHEEAAKVTEPAKVLTVMADGVAMRR